MVLMRLFATCAILLALACSAPAQQAPAVQSGSDDRAPLLDRLRANCAAIGVDDGSSDEFKRYAELVDNFLSYINDHQLLDDVRVMNLVTNIQEPIAQWLSTSESDRAGILDQSLETLKDFRTMFE